jgi:hypothetical protein
VHIGCKSSRGTDIGVPAEALISACQLRSYNAHSSTIGNANGMAGNVIADEQSMNIDSASGQLPRDDPVKSACATLDQETALTTRWMSLHLQQAAVVALQPERKEHSSSPGLKQCLEHARGAKHTLEVHHGCGVLVLAEEPLR